MRPIYLFSISSHPEAIHINPLDITFFQPKIDFSSYDYLIITSKQAVEALKQYDFEEFKNKKALCISRASAKSFQELGGEVLAVGAGYGDTLLEKIKNYPKETQWVYLRAEEIASDFSMLARDEGYSIDEVVLYKSECSARIEKLEIPKDATLVFTSPSSVCCFLKHNEIQSTQRVVVIGDTTAKHIPSGVKCVVSKQRSIDACIQLALDK